MSTEQSEPQSHTIINSPYSVSRHRARHATTDVKQNEDAVLTKLASGQKLVIFAILLSMGLNAQKNMPPMAASVYALIVCGLMLTGALRLASGLRMPVIKTILLMLAMLVPLINIITLIVLNRKANKLLSEGGYKIGLFGAKLKSPS